MAHYTRAQNIVHRTIAGEDFLIVTHAGESRIFTLNGMGLWFWQQLATSASEADLLSAMLNEYAVDEATATAEITRFLAYLLERALIVRVAP